MEWTNCIGSRPPTFGVIRETRLTLKGSGPEARSRFGTHALMDSRDGLVVDVRLTPPRGT